MAFKVIHLSIVFKFRHTFCSNNLFKKNKKKPKTPLKINIKAGNGKAGQLCLENRLLNLSQVCVLFMQLYVNVCPDKALSLQISNQGQMSTSMEIDILSTQDLN